MKTFAFLLIGFFYIQISFSQCDTASSWSSKDKALELTQSPYYYGEQFVSTLKAISFYVGDLPIISSENYFLQLKRVFFLEVTKTGQTSDDLLDSVNEYFNTWQTAFAITEKSVAGLKTFFNSQKMKAVRARDKEQLKSINSILKMLNGLDHYQTAVNILLSEGGSLRECVSIIVRSAQPLMAYDGSLLALQTLMNYEESMPNELVTAIHDIISLIQDSKNSFLVNLSNSNTEILNTILNMGTQIYSSNEEYFNKMISKYLGLRNFQKAEEYYHALIYVRDLIDSLTDFTKIAQSINPAIHTASADIYLNNIIFTSIKENAKKSNNFKPYIECLRFLLLVESINNTNIAEVLNAGKKVKDNSAAVKEAKNTANECIKGFTCLSSQ